MLLKYIAFDHFFQVFFIDFFHQLLWLLGLSKAPYQQPQEVYSLWDRARHMLTKYMGGENLLSQISINSPARFP